MATYSAAFKTKMGGYREDLHCLTPIKAATNVVVNDGRRIDVSINQPSFFFLSQCDGSEGVLCCRLGCLAHVRRIDALVQLCSPVKLMGISRDPATSLSR